ncbi:hypothetical protein [Methylobacterium brachythecii]|uniref:Uncharacterized protein n=1 Tax=Methylobacterium brachythecii TaxID=1176177 RepID=A0A7W6ANC4_9HYPH|nr:hypothetical protein [Methylobacterium brachythecii]MBB3904230.1 hypothetical protein [Methylobacterium brachythecii]GLS45108.1 hypothetical protein GCM10007884_30970 [Methylobacterium brachythecii]
MDEQTHTFAVETSAQIEVLHSAMVALMAEALRRLDPEDREDVLVRFVSTVSDVPPGAPSPSATRFLESVVEAIPRHANRFADEVRTALE